MKCVFCKNKGILYLCRLRGDVYVKHLFKACLDCIEKRDLVIISKAQEVRGGNEEGMETSSPYPR